MKKIFKYIALAAVSTLALSSCDSIFDGLEGDKSKVDNSTMFGSEAGIVRVLSSLYQYIPMGAFSDSDKQTMMANASRDVQSYSRSINTFWDYTKMRTINKFIVDVQEAYENGVIKQDALNAYLGEAMFVRAYCYFASVRAYGGIPIVEQPMDDLYVPGGDMSALYVPRSTEKESWDYVIDQFEKAAQLLPETSMSQMRVNKYVAYAYKAKAALWAASVSKYNDRAPLNPNYNAVKEKLTYMEKAWAKEYYAIASEAAKKVIDSGKYKLAGYSGQPLGVEDAVKTLNDLFQAWDGSEGLLGKSYVTGLSTDNNGVEQAQGGNWGTANQVTSGYLGGTYSLTLNLIEEYDDYAADGSSKSGKLDTGCDDIYINGADNGRFNANTLGQYKRYENVEDIFANKDARFKAWIVYPGCEFRGTKIHMQGGMVKPDGSVSIYPGDNAAVMKNGVAYYPYGGQADQNSAFFKLATDKNDNNRSSYPFVPRKYMNQNACSFFNQTPWYDMRYSEVLLIYAEAYAEGGVGEAALASKCLNDIRHRAGFTDNVEPSLDNILHEYKVEFAMENKLPEVLCRRRALFNGIDVYDHEGEKQNKEIIVPIVDLSGDKAQYIYIRTLSMFGTPTNVEMKQGTIKWGGINGKTYYNSIPNYVKNKLTENNLEY